MKLSHKYGVGGMVFQVLLFEVTVLRYWILQGFFFPGFLVFWGVFHEMGST